MEQLERRRTFRLPRWLWMTGLILIVGILAAVNAANMNKTAQVTAVTAERGVLAETIYANGRLQAAGEQAVFAAAGGTVAEVRVKEGDAVSQGDVLATYDTAEWERELRAARNELEIAKLQRQAERRRAVESVRGLTDAREIDRALAPDRDAQRLHELQTQTLEWTIERLERMIADSALKAPMDGVVVSLGVSAGATIPQGFEAARIADLSRLVVKAALNELDAGRVTPGMAATVTGDAFEGERAGTLTYISPTAEPAQPNAVDYEVSIEVTLSADAGASERLKPGYAATAALTLPGEEQVLVPTEALQFEGGRSYVYKVAEDKAVRAYVTVGKDDGERAEALNGVEAGDRIVVRVPGGLRDGDAVKAVDADD